MVNKWMKELFLTLCNIADKKDNKKLHLNSLGKALLNIDIAKGKNNIIGIDLFCYLLLKKGLPLSLILLLQHRIKNGNYNNCNIIWLESFLSEIEIIFI